MTLVVIERVYLVLVHLKSFMSTVSVWPIEVCIEISVLLLLCPMSLFTFSIFRNTYKSLIYFTFVLVLQGAPVESFQHLQLTMADNLLSVALPPSLLIEAGLSNNNMDNVSRTKSTIKNKQGSIDFMFDDDSTDHKGDTGL